MSPNEILEACKQYLARWDSTEERKRQHQLFHAALYSRRHNLAEHRQYIIEHLRCGDVQILDMPAGLLVNLVYMAMSFAAGTPEVFVEKLDKP